MREAGYGLHHTSEDGKYLIMGNGTQAFAVAAEQPEKADTLKHVEDAIEQNDNHFDGIINNTPTADELEAKARNGEQISLAEYAAALKAEKEQERKRNRGKRPKRSLYSGAAQSRQGTGSAEETGKKQVAGLGKELIMGKLNKFENVDVFASLEAIMKQNTDFIRVILTLTKDHCGKGGKPKPR